MPLGGKSVLSSNKNNDEKKKHNNTNKISGPEISLEYLCIIIQFQSNRPVSIIYQRVPSNISLFIAKADLCNHIIKSVSKVHLRD